MKKKKVFWIVFSIILVIIIAACAALLYLKYVEGKNVEFLGTEVVEDEEEIVVETKKSIFDGNSRPVAVMLDNNKDALPHGGVNQAYLIYEMIVEGGESRLMALFKGVNVEKIGPIRSSRHYFLDYALENDAIYVHYGWSPQAQSDIASLGVNNLNGLVESSSDFWRVSDRKAPHNAVTSTNKITEMANRKRYRTTSTVDSVLNYAEDDVYLESEDAQIANKVSVPFSQSNTASWEYNAENEKYTRYTKGIKESDWNTGEEYQAKNIIIEFVQNWNLNDGENKGRQTLNNIGTKNGYYITNGKAIKITCTKNSRAGQTVYKDSSGAEINVNDGNTFIEICPANANVQIQE